MAFPHSSKAALAAICLALLAPSAAGVLSEQPLYRVTLVGPGTVVVGTAFEFTGSVVAKASSAAPVPLAFQPVTFTLDGVTMGTATTLADGTFRAFLTFPERGGHWLQAWVDKGTLIQGRSDVKLVNVIVPPTLLAVRVDTPPVPGYTHARVSWDVDNGGYDPYLFRLWRSENGAPFQLHANVSHAHRFVDPISPGSTYAYRVVAFNYAGVSAPMEGSHSTPANPVSSVAISSVAASIQCTVQYNHESCPGAGQSYTTQLRVKGSTTGASAGRLLLIAIDTKLQFPCTGGQPGLCAVQPHTGPIEVLVKPDGTFDFTATYAWLWPGGEGATGLNPYDVDISVDGATASASTSMSITTSPTCGSYGCGGWG